MYLFIYIIINLIVERKGKKKGNLIDKTMGGKEQNFGLYLAFESLSLWHLQLLHTNSYRKL